MVCFIALSPLHTNRICESIAIVGSSVIPPDQPKRGARRGGHWPEPHVCLQKMGRGGTAARNPRWGGQPEDVSQKRLNGARSCVQALVRIKSRFVVI